MQPPPPLLAHLDRWGVLRSRPIEHAVRALEWDRLLPPEPGPRGALFAPRLRPDRALEPSPRLSVLLAEFLELAPGLRIALPTPAPLVLSELIRASGARVHDPVRDATADRALILGPSLTAPTLVDGGFALHVSLEPHAVRLVKRVHSAEGDADLIVDGLPLRPQDVPPRPIRHLLVVEGFARRALENRLRTRQDETFADAVADVWDPAAGHRPGRSPEERRRLDAARRWFHLAYIHHFSADLGDAMELYRASIDAHPTAEAHTFLGWAMSASGDYRAAIHECQRGIQVDPGFGNPYNDIGAYLLELGEAERALPWFPRALAAERYEAPHFAHCNAGRALLEMGRPEAAREAFERSLAIAPGYAPAREFLRRLSSPRV